MRVVLVHGYLAPGAVFWPLARRLKRAGHHPETFTYASHRGDIDRHVNALCAALPKDEPYAVVAHSMGGLVTHRALARPSNNKPQAAVFIATPHNGSRLARAARRSPIAPFLSDGARMLASGMNTRNLDLPCGVIVGLKDRTVRPEEARLAGASDSLDLPYGHNELLVRPRTARAVLSFLASGRFEARAKLSWKHI